MAVESFSHAESDRLIRRVKEGDYRPNTGITGYISAEPYNWPFLGSLEIDMDGDTGSVAGEIVEESPLLPGVEEVPVESSGGGSYHQRTTGVVRSMVGGRLEKVGPGEYRLGLEKVPRSPRLASIIGSVDWLLESEDVLGDPGNRQDYLAVKLHGLDEHIGRYSGIYKPPEDEVPVCGSSSEVEAKLAMTRPSPDDLEDVFAQREFPVWVKEAVDEPT